MSWLSSWLGLTRATPTPDADGALIRAAGLQLRRRAFQLHIDTLEVQPGSVVGLVGPNGSGKTTLMEALVGLRPIHAGTVRVVGLDPRRSGAQIRETVAITSATRPLPAMRVGTLLARVAPYYPTWDAELSASRSTSSPGCPTCPRASAPACDWSWPSPVVRGWSCSMSRASASTSPSAGPCSPRCSRSCKTPSARL